MDYALAISFLALASALAASTIFVTLSYVRSISRHQKQTEKLQTFTIAMTRLTLSEWMRVGVKASLPDIDKEVNELQEANGWSRDKAIEAYANRLAGTEDVRNGKSST